jgi:hypothetical protein
MRKNKTIIEKTAWMTAIFLGSAYFLSSHITITLSGYEQQAIVKMLSNSYGRKSEMVVMLILKN